MKLWIKSLIASSIVLIASGASIGSIYAFSKNRNSDQKNLVKNNENSFVSETFFDKDIKKEDIKAYFISLDAISPTKDFFIAEYNYKDNTVLDLKTKTIWPYNDFRDKFVKDFNAPPKMIVNLGSTIWKNEYVDAVYPRDFIDFLKWFIDENAWGPEMFVLDEFTIYNGVKKDGGVIILGDFANLHKEQTKIGFYPDAFFSISSINQGYNSLIYPLEENPNEKKFIKDVVIKEFTEEEIKNYLTKENGQAKIRYINFVGKDDKGQDKYQIYTDVFKNLLDDIAKKYPYLLKTIEGPYIEYDQNNKGTLKKGKYKGFDLESIIPKIAVAGVSYENFEGVGNDWLKYVTAHEYGHHTTLQEAKDISNKFVSLGAFNPKSGYSETSLYDANMLKKYLKTKNKALDFEFVDAYGNTHDINGKLVENGPYFRFKINGQLENDLDIYGYERNTLDFSDFSKIIESLKNTKRRKALVTQKERDWYLNQQFGNSNMLFKTIEEASKAKGVTPLDIFLMNAWDFDSSTLNPDLIGEFQKAYDEKDGKLKNLFEIFKDFQKEDPEAWRKYFVTYYNANGWTQNINVLNDLVKEWKTEVHPDFKSKFSDYAFDPAEQINRDFLQITYMPSKSRLKNSIDTFPLSEYNSGYEYYLLGKPIEDKYFNQNNFYSYISNLKRKVNIDNNTPKNNVVTIPLTNIFLNNYLKANIFNSNGFFKDDYYRRSLNAEIYDENGNPIKDSNIGIEDFNGKLVENRAKAIWMYFLKTKGIGDRNISGFWRHSKADKTYFWGYLKDNPQNNKISKIKFTDEKSGEVTYLKINKNVDNMFYYTQRGKNPQKWTLKDEGFISWSTNYETIGDFQEAKLKVGGNYLMEFVDNANNFVTNVNLGQKKVLTENGKVKSIAPIKIIKDKKNKIKILIERKFV